jgi:hypothetical protein
MNYIHSKIIHGISFLSFMLVPVFANAQGRGITCPTAPFRNVTEIITWGTCLIGAIIPLLTALATVYFIWGVVEFIKNSDNEAKRKEGRARLTWGIVALFVMVSVWGIVAILRGTFGVENVIPQIR